VLSKELFKYAIAGILANSIYFCLYIGFYSIGLHVFLASLISYIICLIFTYKVSKNWTFSAKYSEKKQYKGRFVAVYFSSAIVMAAIITCLVNYQLEYKTAWLAGAVYAIIHNYILSKYYIFAR
jgi:putative flippase GtrA